MRSCSVCGADSEPLLLGVTTPPIQNVLCATGAQALDFPQVQVDFQLCPVCRHIDVAKNESPEFDPSYNNDQSASAVANEHLRCVATEIEGRAPGRAARIVEIGCGRGELLSELRDRGFANVAGYDPAAPDALGGLISRELWTGQGGDADIVILRHALEEIRGADELIRDLSSTLKPCGLFYCEITNGENIVRRGDLFSLYPECSHIFSAASLTLLLQKHGLHVEGISRHFDDEWLGVWARKVPAALRGLTADELRARFAARLRALPQPVVLWGIGGRGANFLSFLQADRTLVSQVVDLNASKQGLFVPPFGHRVLSPDEVRDLPIGTILVSSKRYLREIATMVPAGWSLISIDQFISPESDPTPVAPS